MRKKILTVLVIAATILLAGCQRNIQTNPPTPTDMQTGIPTPEPTTTDMPSPTLMPTPELATDASAFIYTVKSDETIEITKLKDTSLTVVIVPEVIDGRKVTEIGDRVFYGCNALTSVTIPESMTAIGNEAFTYCRGLTRVTIP